MALASIATTALAGCILLAGGTSGYTSIDAGGTCTSALECGDSSQVCCLSESATLASHVATGVCAASCVVAVPQLCAAAAECGEGGTCTTQSCDAGLAILPVTACGVVTSCGSTN